MSTPWPNAAVASGKLSHVDATFKGVRCGDDIASAHLARAKNSLGIAFIIVISLLGQLFLWANQFAGPEIWVFHLNYIHILALGACAACFWAFEFYQSKIKTPLSYHDSLEIEESELNLIEWRTFRLGMTPALTIALFGSYLAGITILSIQFGYDLNSTSNFMMLGCFFAVTAGIHVCAANFHVKIAKALRARKLIS